MYHVPLALQCINGCSDEGGENGKEGREWRLPILLYADDLVLCSESGEDRWWNALLRCEREEI